MLSYRLISKEDHPKLRRLLEESFPPEETLPFEFYVSDFRNLGIHVEGAYRENELVGFLHYVVRPEFVYLAFFAFFDLTFLIASATPTYLKTYFQQ